MNNSRGCWGQMRPIDSRTSIAAPDFCYDGQVQTTCPPLWGCESHAPCDRRGGRADSVETCSPNGVGLICLERSAAPPTRASARLHASGSDAGSDVGSEGCELIRRRARLGKFGTPHLTRGVLGGRRDWCAKFQAHCTRTTPVRAIARKLPSCGGQSPWS